jgi:tRNA A37 threonylcarbamoyladenosine dehydratase
MNRFARLHQLLGDAKFNRLKTAAAAVCGLGAVGSFAVEALARAGVGRLRLIDFDTIGISNINRQLLALDSTQGLAKVQVAATRVTDINPDCQVTACRGFIDDQSVGELLTPRPMVLIDAIDGLSSKVHLLRHAVSQQIYTVSSMGAAGRFDPAAIAAADIADTHTCPLARVVRKRLHRHGIRSGIRCIFSTEAPLNKLPAPAQDHEIASRGRSRTPLGSMVTITGMFGLWAAAEAIEYLLTFPEKRLDR